MTRKPLTQLLMATAAIAACSDVQDVQKEEFKGLGYDDQWIKEKLISPQILQTSLISFTRWDLDRRVPGRPVAYVERQGATLAVIKENTPPKLSRDGHSDRQPSGESQQRAPYPRLREENGVHFGLFGPNRPVGVSPSL